MADPRAMQALERIETALARIEAAAGRADAADTARLRQAHATLRNRVESAIGQIDLLLDGERA